MTDAPAVIVPIDVQALVVRDGDGTEFAGVAADFSALPEARPDDPGASPGYLARRAFAAPFRYSDRPPPAGIHLHWAMPDALVRGARDRASGRTDFPPLPNRWLVARIAAPPSGPPQLKAWTIESDHFWTAPPPPEGPNRLARAVPIDPLKGEGKTWRAMGRVTPLEATPASPTPGADRGGFRLTALGYGAVEYAAAYAYCPNVFGFWDEEAPTEGEVSYQVVGWFADPAHEPLARGKLADLRWTLAETANLTATARTLCAGSVISVSRSAKAPGGPEGRTIAAKLALGRMIPEAVAALLVQTRGGPGTDEEERSQVALQLGLLQRGLTPDSAAEVDEACHLNTFAARPAGTAWTARPKSGDMDALPPDELAAALAALDEDQAIFDAVRARFVDSRRQIFADWHAVTNANESDPDWADAFNLIAGEIEALLGLGPDDAATADAGEAAAWIAFALDADMRRAAPAATRPTWPGGLLKTLLDRRGDLAQRAASLGAQADRAGWALAPAPQPPFYEPADPVILIDCPEVSLHPRHGGDGAGEPDGLLVCRLESQLHKPDAGVVWPALPAGFAGPREAAALLAETLLFDPATRAALGLPKQAAPADVSGRNAWSGPPWLPLLVQWDVEIEIDDVAPDLGRDFTLDHGEVELIRRAGPTPARRIVSLSGQTHLTTRTALNLQSALKAYSQTHAAGDPPPTDPALGTCAALTLSGFHAILLKRERRLQLPPVNPFAAEIDRLGAALNILAPLAVGAENVFEPAEGALTALSPLGAWGVNIRRLRIVDAFGQYRDVEIDKPLAPLRFDRSAKGAPELPPRLAQPSRLRLRWLPGDDRGPPMAEPSVCRSPICGWVAVNRLEHALALYGADGAALGALVPELAALQPSPDGGAAPGGQLKAFADALLRQTGAVDGLMAAIDAQMAGVNPLGLRQDQGLALLAGTPLALVRVTLRLELCGLPALAQGVEGLKGYDDRADRWRTFAARDNGEVGKLEIPLRLGDLGVLEDGLIGYFLPGADGFTDYATFYAAAYAPEHKRIVGEPGVGVKPAQAVTLRPSWLEPAVEASACAWRAAAGEPADLTLALLIDPRGAVHVTTGVLPVAEMRLPPAHVSQALRRIALSFPCGPALTPADGVALPELPLPREPGFAWTWTTPGGAPQPFARRVSLLTSPATLRLREGWLTLAQNPAPSKS